MAKKDNNKPGFFTRVRNFFKSIVQEVKRVSWTDGKTLRQNTATVLVIIFIAAASIWLFDMAIQGVLTAAGFYSEKDRAPIAAPAELPEATVAETTAESADPTETEAEAAPAETEGEEAAETTANE